MKYLYKQPTMRPDLLREQPVQRYIHKTAEVLNRAVDEGIRQVPASQITIDRLKESNLVFSGFKVFHQMKEAFPALVDEAGVRRSFEEFSKDVQKVHEKYNTHYLRSEYQFAVGSSQMAAKWEKFEAMGDRYDLQYLTAKDERVRDSHAKLDGVTLPITSRFWNDYFPPNGWGCRCDVVQVRKGKYPEADEHRAMEDANQATTGKHQEMFWFNPGKEKAAFPAYNPYTISACRECKKSAFKLAANIPANELCQACGEIQGMRSEEEEWQRKISMTNKNAGIQVKAEARRLWSNRTIESRNLASHEMRISHEILDAFVYHCSGAECKWVVPSFLNEIQNLRWVRFSELGEGKDMSNPKDRANVEEKQRQGVQGYQIYHLDFRGNTYVVGTASIICSRTRDAYETPYFMAKLRPPQETQEEQDSEEEPE